MKIVNEVLEDQRRKEILKACAKLYETKGYNEISIKDISTITSFSRPTIYNYFHTKEEIFLAMLCEEYEKWISDIRNIHTDASLSKSNLLQQIGNTLESRKIMLKISAMNLYEIEQNSSEEWLYKYKIVFVEAMRAVTDCIASSLQENRERIERLVSFAFFPFLYGIYPFVYPTDKQVDAMKDAGFESESKSISEITIQFLEALF